MRFLLVLAALLLAVQAHKIKHIVVLMEENRSFDNLLGWYNRSKHGLKGTEYNLLNASDPKSKKIFVSKDSPYINFCDPDHSTPATTYKIFGPHAYHEHPPNRTDPKMSAFVEWERDVMDHRNPNLQYCGVMDAFAPGKLPVLEALADEFVLFDKFHCSYPGPTWPNRLFFLLATSAGLTETIPWYKLEPGRLFPQKTIFDQVEEAGLDWKLYYRDTPWELFVEKVAHSPHKTQNMDNFFADAKTGNLPSFSFINPRAGINLTTGLGSDDMHPDHDVALSELLYKQVYEALRASPQWNETLFVLTFDEHGGLYDHIHPPENIPAPDNHEAYPDSWVKFSRAGIRIPTILASPWLKRGKIVSDPPAPQKPQNNSIYELTSILATTRKLLPNMSAVGPLTKRDAWAATFEHLFDDLTEPRTDCPMQLPEPPKPTLPSTESNHERNLPVNSLQHTFLTMNAALIGEDVPADITTQGQVSEWLSSSYSRHKEIFPRWQREKNHPSFHLIVAPTYLSPKYEGMVAFRWDLNVNKTQPNFITISADVKLDASDASGSWEKYCFTSNHSEGATVAVAPCYPKADPARNKDVHQHWLFKTDSTIRPAGNTSLCITTHAALKHHPSKIPFLASCEDKVTQHYSYQGVAPGMDPKREIRFGDGVWTFQISTKKN